MQHDQNDYFQVEGMETQMFKDVFGFGSFWAIWLANYHLHMKGIATITTCNQTRQYRSSSNSYWVHEEFVQKLSSIANEVAEANHCSPSVMLQLLKWYRV
ncbi:hypothetical protein FRX31_027454 [Thalictrum thalictroides]|uniref:Uncharacterized protein n=1 Tax=Thalictrum thalictroides TaxID=46969 RepID=A0A7J6VEA4_THATH|nr:hypothetical protein FRX31_027454 [Thalictrum thalictroides]